LPEAPQIPEPQAGNNRETGRLITTVTNSYAYQNIFFIGLGIFGINIEITALVENTRIGQFILPLGAWPLPVGIQEFSIWKFPVGVLIQVLHVRMCGGIIKVVIQLFYIFPVVTLITAQAEQSFFYYRILSVPEARGKTEPAKFITYTGYTVFSPPV